MFAALEAAFVSDGVRSNVRKAQLEALELTQELCFGAEDNDTRDNERSRREWRCRLVWRRVCACQGGRNRVPGRGGSGGDLSQAWRPRKACVFTMASPIASVAARADMVNSCSLIGQVSSSEFANLARGSDSSVSHA
eukprot:TRINITY_DN5899_c0_g1_i3.p3 TRINITY_DN5899_c0_g1~~TRINITY_DN5899_c0_g1_i3.p3  ORF type:complete len:137 (-),score=9.40 TRINITY_DN5899_c0_g1_i3:117-527(-)